jgi:hypothetical protein
MSATSGPGLVGGTFRDVAQAQGAFDGLMREARAGHDVDVAFFCSCVDYIVLVSAKTGPAYERATIVLRDHDALEDSNLNRLLTAARNAVVHSPPGSGKTELLVRWIRSFLALQDAGLVGPSDLVALAMAVQNPAVERAPSKGSPDRDERARLLREADAELREVTGRLTLELRSQHPDLFDRRGRLRKRALSERLKKQLGNPRRLSGADLQALEDAADAEATRSANAP